MPHVILAELGGNVWLVGGEEHIDDLLANTLAPGITIGFVQCDSRADLRALWEQHSTDEIDGAEPWVIHPGIVRRIRGSQGKHTLGFTPWSAMLDASAQATIATAAEQLAHNPAATLTLRQFCPADPPPGLADLQRLRGQLVEGCFGRAGIPAARLVSETREGTEADSDRIDLVTADGKGG